MTPRDIILTCSCGSPDAFSPIAGERLVHRQDGPCYFAPALTEEEREALDQSLAESGCHGFVGDHPDLYDAAERIIEARQVSRPWRPEDGDTRCQSCGMAYVAWFADNSVWNVVMGGPDAKGDPGGVLCPRCFTVRAEEVMPGRVWHLTVEQLALLDPERWENTLDDAWPRAGGRSQIVRALAAEVVAVLRDARTTTS